VVPPRYDRGDWREGDGVFNAAAIASYTVRLADRIERHVRAGEFPVVLGGDCSIQLGASLALRRVGRYGLAAIDASPDSGTPATPTGSARRAARRSRWAPGAGRRTRRTWRGSGPICGTRTCGSSGSVTRSRRTGPNSPP
jgi:arginase